MSAPNRLGPPGRFLIRRHPSRVNRASVGQGRGSFEAVQARGGQSVWFGGSRLTQIGAKWFPKILFSVVIDQPSSASAKCGFRRLRIESGMATFLRPCGDSRQQTLVIVPLAIRSSSRVNRNRYWTLVFPIREISTWIVKTSSKRTAKKKSQAEETRGQVGSAWGLSGCGEITEIPSERSSSCSADSIIGKNTENGRCQPHRCHKIRCGAAW